MPVWADSKNINWNKVSLESAVRVTLLWRGASAEWVLVVYNRSENAKLNLAYSTIVFYYLAGVSNTCIRKTLSDISNMYPWSLFDALGGVTV